MRRIHEAAAAAGKVDISESKGAPWAEPMMTDEPGPMESEIPPTNMNDEQKEVIAQIEAHGGMTLGEVEERRNNTNRVSDMLAAVHEASQIRKEEEDKSGILSTWRRTLEKGLSGLGFEIKDEEGASADSAKEEKK